MGSNPTRVLFFDYIIEDKVFENSKSQCYRILMVYVLSILHCRTNSGQISHPDARRIDTALIQTSRAPSDILAACSFLLIQTSRAPSDILATFY